MKLSRRSREE